MNTNKQSFNWILDAVLLLGFLLAFFLDLTGLDLHQWLGVGLGAVAGYHMLRHWDWVRAVTSKFFSRTQPRVLAYYTLDVALLLGFFLIISTGVAISTWLSLAAGVYAVWKNLHVYTSVITLLLVVLKIGLHWRWIVKTAARFAAPRPAAQGLVPAAAQAGISRRHFLTLMSVVGLASWAAVNHVVAEDQTANAQSETTTTAAGTSASSAASTTANTTTGTTSSSTTSCVLRCNKRCSYPGKCRKYVDSNKNSKCDLGECA
jgi:hypothetical protein